ncbi:FixH family protein [Chitinimonas koreensis]|uniref:FixH family protein n=1 Tax=Chitinimonas koreensis TaxID=356302 RepID=UPI00042168B9|nr:FixH family protein [Chitinimonas koreensis]QNM98021.1 FixH family protein [Chitinimonas koreensis]
MSNPNAWYRQPVIWLFLTLLIVTVAACFALIGVAIRSDDGLVADDYYKRGNEIGLEIHRDRQAVALGLSAQLLVGDDGKSVRVLLMPPSAEAKTVVLRLAHPTRAGLDRVLTLHPAADDMLVAALDAPLPEQRWLVQIEDGQNSWRLRGESRLGPGAALTLKPQQP